MPQMQHADVAMLMHGCCPLEYSNHVHAQEPSGLRSTNEESNEDSGSSLTYSCHPFVRTYSVHSSRRTSMRRQLRKAAVSFILASPALHRMTRCTITTEEGFPTQN